MEMPAPSLIEDIRTASRQMVRRLGFMQSTLAATDYPPSAVHALLEIGARGSMTAGAVAECLALEKSSVSRMLRKLLDAGELAEAPSVLDARAKDLVLTAQGEATRARIEDFGRTQVSQALARLRAPEREAARLGLATYAGALAGTPPAPAAAEILQGYLPGALGRITEMHAAFYARHAGFGQVFESQVAAGLAAFAARLESPRNGLWTAVRSGRVVGSVAIDGQSFDDGAAQLRWFIVDDGERGGGLGRRLLRQALDFCDGGGFAETRLWTFAGLDAARKLYEDHGFEQVREEPGTQWGRPVLEQLLRRAGRPPDALPLPGEALAATAR